MKKYRLKKTLYSVVLGTFVFLLGVNPSLAKAESAGLSLNSLSAEEEVDLLATGIYKRVTRKWSRGYYYESDKQSPYYRPIPRSIRVSDIINRRYYTGTLYLESYYATPKDYVATYSGRVYLNSKHPKPMQIINISE